MTDATGATGSFERRVPSTRRRVRNGVRLKAASVDDLRGRGWVARRWLDLVGAVVPDVQERVLGFDYARQGQTTRLEVGPGWVRAQVQGRVARPYAVSWSIPVYSAVQWRAIVNAMANEAFYRAFTDRDVHIRVKGNDKHRNIDCSPARQPS